MAREVRAIVENGQIYYDCNEHNCVIAQRLTGESWVLLSCPAPAEHGGTHMTVIPGANGRLFYTRAELQERLEKEGWQYTKARLTVQVATVRDGMILYGEEGRAVAFV